MENEKAVTEEAYIFQKGLTERLLKEKLSVAKSDNNDIRKLEKNVESAYYQLIRAVITVEECKEMSDFEKPNVLKSLDEIEKLVKELRAKMSISHLIHTQREEIEHG